MPKIIEIDGIIGIDVWPSMISQQLKAAGGEEVEILFSSPGGFVDDGLAIFNHIHDYQGKTTAKIIGMAASMASYIPLSADKVIAKSNAVYMIHDALMGVYGNEAEHTKAAKILGGFSNLLADIYSKKTGKTKDEIRALMQEETYFFGPEMLEAGFVDEIDEINVSEDRAKDDIILDVMMKVESTTQRVRDRREDFEKIAAYLKPENTATTFKDFPVADIVWNSSDAIERVREFLGAEDAPNKEYASAFFWYDSAASENFTSYKLPFCDVVDGELTAIRNAWNNAAARLNQTNIPAADKEKVRSHIDKYQAKWERLNDSKPRTGATNQSKEVNMTLDEFLAQNAEAKALYDKRLNDAKTEARAEGENSVRATVTTMKPYLESEAYTDIHKECIGAILGEQDVATVKALAIFTDKQAEKEKSATAAAESELNGDTQTGQQAEVDTNKPKSVEDIKALADSMKHKPKA